MEHPKPSSASPSASDSDSDSDWDGDSFFDAVDFLEDTEPFEPIGIPIPDDQADSSSPAKAKAEPLPVINRESVSDSEITVEPDPPARRRAVINRPPPPPPQPSLLESLINFIIRAIFFQVSIIVKFITFPLRLLHFSITLITDPFGFVRRIRNYVLSKLLLIVKRIGDRLGLQDAGKVAVRIFRGSFWAIYVCTVLMGMFLGSFLGGGLLVRRIVERPVRIKEELNFDYTKPSPAALVPLSSCNFKPEIRKEWSGMRVIPVNHKLELTVLLNLPESDYNRRLGVFQIRAEFMSSDGRVLHTRSQPCMLKFKSSHMHLLETFINTLPLITGYSSEAQLIKIKMKGIKEGTDPTACIRLILEQRAEFKPNAGIPEIYSASLNMESDLPLLKKIIWIWRWTIFVWTSTGIFVFVLLVALLCCRSVVIPQTIRLPAGPARQVR